MRVLIVDDDAEVRKILATALREKALTIDEAENGRAAIDLLHENVYAVVMLDLMMPVTDGFAVLNAIRSDLPNPPVVLVVTGASRELIERVDTERIHGVIRKPFDPVEVASIVAACAEVRSRGPFETMAIATMLSGGALIPWVLR
ncbi:MAG TPA: response regulator [Thermoanaerobaculia bacterium]|nr:response regulator [Thermoanaerobaculia bacterium]